MAFQRETSASKLEASSCSAEAPTFRAQAKAEREAKRQQAAVEAAARTWRGKRKNKSPVRDDKLDEWSRDSQLRLQLELQLHLQLQELLHGHLRERVGRKKKAKLLPEVRTSKVRHLSD